MSYLYHILAATFLAISQQTERIENGISIPASNNLSRTIALLETDSGRCTASFIHRRFLITAAHCTYRASVANTEVLIRDANGTWYSVAVKRLITHPRFEMKKTSAGTKVKYDVALVEILTEFPLPINLLTLGSISDLMDQEKIVNIYGYGKSSPSSGSGVLKYGQMRAIVEPIPLFHDRLGLSMTPNTNQVLCGGDSGGPVIKVVNSRGYLIGINSLSNGCKNAPDPTSKAEILRDQVPWIRKYVPGI